MAPIFLLCVHYRLGLLSFSLTIERVLCFSSLSSLEWQLHPLLPWGMQQWPIDRSLCSWSLSPPPALWPPDHPLTAHTASSTAMWDFGSSPAGIVMHTLCLCVTTIWRFPPWVWDYVTGRKECAPQYTTSTLLLLLFCLSLTTNKSRCDLSSWRWGFCDAAKWERWLTGRYHSHSKGSWDHKEPRRWCKRRKMSPGLRLPLPPMENGLVSLKGCMTPTYIFASLRLQVCWVKTTTFIPGVWGKS